MGKNIAIVLLIFIIIGFIVLVNYRQVIFDHRVQEIELSLKIAQQEAQNAGNNAKRAEALARAAMEDAEAHIRKLEEELKNCK